MKIVRIWEGLGNQLFQYAYARAYQLHTGEDVRLDKEEAFKDKFPNGEGKSDIRSYNLSHFRIALQGFDVEKSLEYRYLGRKNCIEKYIYEKAKKGKWKYNFWEECEEPHHYKVEFTNISGEAYIKGWFQNEKYFKDVRHIILKDLKLTTPVVMRRELKHIYEKRTLVSVHIRRGDYIKNNIALPKEYYYRAIEKMNSIIENPAYLVFTDDMNWAKSILDGREEVYFISDYGTYRDFEELILMSRCVHNIIANSSFSWWGAWLNNNEDKIVLTPNRWPFTKRKNDLSILPEEWERIDIT